MLYPAYRYLKLIPLTAIDHSAVPDRRLRAGKLFIAVLPAIATRYRRVGCGGQRLYICRRRLDSRRLDTAGCHAAILGQASAETTAIGIVEYVLGLC